MSRVWTKFRDVKEYTYDECGMRRVGEKRIKGLEENKGVSLVE